MNGMYNIAIKSLSAFQIAMNTTSQNIANVQTPYYSRREVNFSEGLFGTGVNIGDINRVYDTATSQNLQTCASNFSNMDIFLRGLQTLEPLVDDDDNSIATYINNTIASLQELNTDTSSIQARDVFLNNLTTMINQFDTVNSQIMIQQQTINSQLLSATADCNSIMENIATINNQVANAPANEDTTSLYDQREQLVQELAKYFDFSSETDSRGQLNIFLNNGIQLINANQVTEFTTIPDPSYPTLTDVALSNGSINIPVNSFITGGQIAGLLNFRDTLSTTSQSIGQLALGITQSLNQQNQLGMDYNGNLGGNIFTDINSASSMSTRVIPNTQNTGSGTLTVNVNDLTQLTASDYKMVFDTSTHYTLTRISDNTISASGTLGSLPQTVSADGFTINVNSGPIAAGDQFIISPTRNAVNNMQLAIADPKLLALAFPITGTANTQSGSDGQIQITAMTDTTTSAFSTPKQLNPPINIVFLTPTTYQIQNANTSAVIEGPLTYNPETGANVFPTPGGYDPGYRAMITGSDIQAGDVYSIAYNSNGTSDNRNGLALANLFQQGILDDGTVNFTQCYRLLSGAVSQQTSAVKTQYDSTQILHEQAMNEFNQISGVDTQEETVNLMSYQQAYQASAQILQTAKNVFDDIIMALRA